ncbi:nectin-3-like protein, partial [Tachysurus ichikawai]
VSGFQVLVPPKINGELGMSVVLSCRIQLDFGQSLTQSSWERRLPSGWVTVAAYDTNFGISIQPEYEHCIVYHKPSIHDSTIILNDLRFSDAGDYKCKVTTFPLGIERALTTLSVLCGFLAAINIVLVAVISPTKAPYKAFYLPQGWTYSLTVRYIPDLTKRLRSEGLCSGNITALS